MPRKSTFDSCHQANTITKNLDYEESIIIYPVDDSLAISSKC